MKRFIATLVAMYGSLIPSRIFVQPLEKMGSGAPAAVV